MSRKLTGRYAKSLIDLAREQGSLEQVHADMLLFNKALESKDLVNLVKSPIISAEKKNSVFSAIFADKINPLTLSYLKLLTSKGREKVLGGIAQSFLELYQIQKGITSVRIISAVPLEESVMQTIKQRFLASVSTAENLEIHTKVDPSLIGGFIVEFEDKRYDASIASKLANLKAEFQDNQYLADF